ncbi:tripartite tricarboxylate transporter substrate binding protein [Roseomonas eburnea]|uniref:Tripartite tricarboxylate transporter substrate binding protein n=1 Tax=Neoroseomonas eburnea TaxID=1346889 RepID=A0A9X9X720_9PROT|nr:tripartite tricarboxylate transporter substrate binding protein [Neoroseomonas eburnea]MBR0679506.1 tripartite tricarboxylate transporter substrate binding protein [Neoroseomonas eburnea]
MTELLRRRALLAAPAVLLAPPAGARPRYPGQQAVTIVLPYTPSGLPTLLGNMMTQGLAQRLGGSFVADYRPGASTSIGARQVARARPDGTTLLMGSVTTFTVVPHVIRNPGYDPLADFDHLTMIGNTLSMLIGHPRWTDLAAVVAEARRRPGELSYATFGNGSSAHLVMLDFLRRAGIEMLHVPFGGSGPAITEILAGRVDVMFSTFASARPHVEAGRLRGFGVPSAARVRSMPEIPTMIEQGYEGFTFDAWLSVAAPAGTPEPIRTVLEAAFIETFADTDNRARLAGLGLEPSPPGAAAVRESIRRNLALNRELLAQAGVTPE